MLVTSVTVIAEVASSGAVRAAPLNYTHEERTITAFADPYHCEMSARQPPTKVTAPGAAVISKRNESVPEKLTPY